MRPAYLARQAIVDAESRIYGYELLFRDSAENLFARTTPGDQASAKVINQTLFVHGLEKIANHRVACINVTERLLLEGVSRVLPTDRVVLELVEDIPASPEVIEACQSLHGEGYSLALHCARADNAQAPLFQFVRLVKVDFRRQVAERRETAERLRELGEFRLVAEKLEEAAEFDEAREAGYDLFQGYFFSKPEMVAGGELHTSKEQFVRFLEEVSRPVIDFDKLSEIISADVSLSMRLMRYVSSFTVGMRSKVQSIRHALVLLGQRRLSKWGALTAMENLSYGKPTELMVSSLVRARSCERMAGLLSREHESFDFFLAGMLTNADAMLDLPLSDALKEMKVSAAVQTAVTAKSNPLGKVVALILAHERADWTRSEQLSAELGVNPAQVADIYFEALSWADGTVVHSDGP